MRHPNRLYLPLHILRTKTCEGMLKVAINLRQILNFYMQYYVFERLIKFLLQIQAVKLFLLVNIVVFGLIVLLTRFLVDESNRDNVVGWICLVFSLCVFVAPLCVVVSSLS